MRRFQWRCRESNPGPSMLAINVYKLSWRSDSCSGFVGQRSSPKQADESWLRGIGVVAAHLDFGVGLRPLSREGDSVRDRVKGHSCSDAAIPQGVKRCKSYR